MYRIETKPCVSAPCLLFTVGVSRAVVLALAISVCGCMRTMGPKMPKELGSPGLGNYSGAELKNDVSAYRKAISSRDFTSAQSIRDQIAYRVMADIETGYGGFEMKLTSSRAGIETTADTVQLGITAATAVVGIGDVKDMLASSLSGFQGTRLSFDKNFFEEKTTDALISQMRANRKTIEAQLILNLGTRDVLSYPLDAVWVDLVDFYYAGTLPSALVAISSNAGASANQATTTLNNAVAALTPTTPAQAKQSVDIRSAYTKLAAAAQSDNAATSTVAIQNLRQILTGVGYQIPNGAAAADLLALFRQAMAEAAQNNDKLKTLSDAVANAKIE